MKRSLLAACICLTLAGGAELFALPSAAEVLGKLDANMSFSTISYSGRMEITAKGQTRVKTMKAIAAGAAKGAAGGEDKAFVEFTNPEDRGVRYLKLGNKLWMYFPKDQETVPIAGHLLKNGMMGSDLSYEDALESEDLASKYDAQVIREEELDGRKCAVVELTAKSPNAPYDRLLLWADEERWISLKEEMYAKSGKLLKTKSTLEAKRIGERWFPLRSELASALVKGSKTSFILEDVELDGKIEDGQFTMAALTK
jgi:outer membrane lipoprotein-sorting protein